MIFNQRGSALIAVVGIAIILNITIIAVFFATGHTSKVSWMRREKVSALNIAEAGKDRFYADIRADIHRPKLNSPKMTIYTNEPLAGAGGVFSVSYTSSSWADTLWIRSVGTTPGGKKTAIIDVVALLSPAIPINANPTRGAVTANADVRIQGNITIDGRDNDTACNVIGLGTFAVSTSGTCTVDGSATVGGNGQGPVNKNVYDNNMAVHQTVAQENTPLDPSIFDSPEAFLGVEIGALDEYKISSFSLDENFHGLIYDTASYVGPVHFGEWASGILIVHNGSKTAKLKINGGTFRGLIICDEMDKINGDVEIRGAVVVLKGTEIVFEGKGTARICYSNQILTHLSQYCGTSVRNTITEISWKETN